MVSLPSGVTLLVGGYPRGDVWGTNDAGVSWQQKAEAAPWGGDLRIPFAFQLRDTLTVLGERWDLIGSLRTQLIPRDDPGAWSTLDGVTWTHSVAGAPYPVARSTMTMFNAVVLGGDTVVIIGAAGETYLTSEFQAWVSAPAPSLPAGCEMVDRTLTSCRTPQQGGRQQAWQHGVLDLSELGIETIAAAGDPFGGLGAVTRLLLGGNRLNSVPSGLLRPMPALEEVSLANNALQHLPDALFESTPGLRHLQLQGNGMVQLPSEDVFAHLPQLQRLRLEDNLLSSLRGPTVFAAQTQLARLSLQGNRLQTLPAGVFDQLALLHDLNLGRNLLRLVPSSTFDAVADTLQRLDVTLNPFPSPCELAASTNLLGQSFCEGVALRYPCAGSVGGVTLERLSALQFCPQLVLERQTALANRFDWALYQGLDAHTDYLADVKQWGLVVNGTAAPTNGTASWTTAVAPDGGAVLGWLRLDVTVHFADGSVSAALSTTVKYDGVTPAASFQPPLAAVTTSADLEAVLACSEPGCQFKYRLDQGSWRTVVSDTSASLEVAHALANVTWLDIPPPVSRSAAIEAQLGGGQDISGSWAVSVDGGAAEIIPGFAQGSVTVAKPRHGPHWATGRRFASGVASATSSTVAWGTFLAAPNSSVALQARTVRGWLGSGTPFVVDCEAREQCRLRVADARSGEVEWGSRSAAELTLLPASAFNCTGPGTPGGRQLGVGRVQVEDLAGNVGAVYEVEPPGVPSVVALLGAPLPQSGPAFQPGALVSGPQPFVWELPRSGPLLPGDEPHEMWTEYRIMVVEANDSHSRTWTRAHHQTGATNIGTYTLAAPGLNLTGTTSDPAPVARLLEVRAVEARCGRPVAGPVTQYEWVTDPSVAFMSPLPMTHWALRSGGDIVAWLSQCSSGCEVEVGVEQSLDGSTWQVWAGGSLAERFGQLNGAAGNITLPYGPGTARFRRVTVSLFRQHPYALINTVSHGWEVLGILDGTALDTQLAHSSPQDVELPSHAATFVVEALHGGSHQLVIEWALVCGTAAAAKDAECSRVALDAGGNPTPAATGWREAVAGAVQLAPGKSPGLYTFYARARHAGGWVGSATAVSWEVALPRLAFVTAPEASTTRNSAGFEFKLEQPLLQATARARPWDLWPEYSLECNGYEAPAGWMRAPPIGLSPLKVGPLPLDTTCTLHARAVSRLDGPGPIIEHTWKVLDAGGSSFTLVGVAEGVHVLHVNVSDVSGNLNSTTATWRVDTKPPAASASVTSPVRFGDISKSPNVTVLITASDHLPPQDGELSAGMGPCTDCVVAYSVRRRREVGGHELLPGSTVPAQPHASVMVHCPTDGVYELWLQGSDGAGNEWHATTSSVTWSVDTTPPESNVAIMGGYRHEGRVYINRTAVTFNVTSASEDAWRASLAVGSVYVEPEVPLGTTTAVGLPHGTHAVTARVTDKAGNTDEVGAADTLVVDLHAPNTAIPSTPALFTNDTQLNVTFGAAEHVPDQQRRRMASSEVLRGHHVMVSVSIDDVRSYFVPGTVGTLALTRLGRGTHDVVIDAVAEDLSGNRGARRRLTVVVDTDAPLITNASLPARHGNNPLPYFTLTASEPNCTFVVGVYTDDSGVTGQHVFTTTGVTTSHARSASWRADEALTEGEYRARAFAVDLAGNFRPPVDVGYWRVDLTAPRFALHVPDEVRATGYIRDASWLLTLGCMDAVPDACRFVVRLDSLVVGPSERPGPFSVAASAEGLHRLEVWVTDGAGNDATATNVTTWYRDTTPPQIHLVSWRGESPPPPQVAAGALTAISVDAVALRVTCTDASGSHCLASWRYTYTPPDATTVCGGSGGSSGSGSSADSTTSAWQPIPHSGLLTWSSLVDGGYVVDVQATDAAGNVAETSFRWAIDTVAPVKPTHETETPETTSRSSIVLQATVIDASPLLANATMKAQLNDQAAVTVPGLEVDLRRNTVVGNVAVGDVSGSLNNDNPLPDGFHRLKVWLVDAAGNEGVKYDHGWTVSQQPPDTVLMEWPAKKSGRKTAVLVFRAIHAVTTAGVDSSLNGTFQVQLASNSWLKVCSGEGTPGEKVINDGFEACRYSQVLGDPGTYTARVRAVNGLGKEDTDPASITWTFIQCTDEQVAVMDHTTGAIECKECPAGGDCEGTDVLAEAIQAKDGFWSGAEQTSATTPFYECPIDGACLGRRADPANPNVTLPAGCAPGYGGVLCSVCEPGWVPQFGACVQCPESAEGKWLVIAGIACGLVVVGGILFFTRQWWREATDIATIVVTWCQIIASANTAMAIPWPDVFVSFMNLLKVLLLDLLALTQSGCAAPMTFFDSLAVSLAALIGISGITFAGLVYYDRRDRRREVDARQRSVALAVAGALGGGRHSGRSNDGADRRHKNRRRQRALVVAPPVSSATSTTSDPTAGAVESRWAKLRRRSGLAAIAPVVAEVPDTLFRMRWGNVMKALAMFWMLCYPGISVKLFRVFQCFSLEWGRYAILSIIMLSVYTIGWPAGMAVWLYRNRGSLDSPATLSKLGFMYELYGTHAYQWGVVELARKLVLTSLVLLFFDKGSALQITFALLVSAFAHVSHALWRPFVDRRAYLLQHGALAVTTIVYTFGLLFKVRTFTTTQEVGAGGATAAGDGDSTVFTALGVVLVVICGGWLVWAAFVAALKLLSVARRFRLANARNHASKLLSPSKRPAVPEPEVRPQGVADGDDLQSPPRRQRNPMYRGGGSRADARAPQPGPLLPFRHNPMYRGTKASPSRSADAATRSRVSFRPAAGATSASLTTVAAAAPAPQARRGSSRAGGWRRGRGGRGQARGRGSRSALKVGLQQQHVPPPSSVNGGSTGHSPAAPLL